MYGRTSRRMLQAFLNALPRTRQLFPQKNAILGEASNVWIKQMNALEMGRWGWEVQRYYGTLQVGQAR